MRVKPVFRYDPSQRKLRLFRLLWSRGTMMRGGYSAKLSLSAVPRLIGWSREWQSWRVTLVGLQLHYLRSYGGTIV